MATAKKTETGKGAAKAANDPFLAAFSQCADLHKDTVSALLQSAKATSKSLDTLNTRSVAFARQSTESALTAARNMAAARSVEELIAVQADYTKTALDACAGELSHTGELMSDMVKDGFQPLSARMSGAANGARSATG